MNHWLVRLAVVAGVAIFIALMVWVVVAGDRDEQNDNRRHTDECIARGGTVILDRDNWYDGCKIGPQRDSG